MAVQSRFDINADLGESYGVYRVGNDEALFPYLNSCNIACGFHGGDPWHIEKALEGAAAHGLRIGAHPSYPDRAGFGRRYMQLLAKELIAVLKYQIAVLQGLCQSKNLLLQYVKPHGALYNRAAKDSQEAQAVVKAIVSINDQLALMGPADSELEAAAQQAGLSFIAEAFADRKYQANGQLQSRTEKGALIQNAEEAAKQVHAIMKGEAFPSCDGPLIQVRADSICIHGDNPAALAILQAIHKLVI